MSKASSYIEILGYRLSSDKQGWTINKSTTSNGKTVWQPQSYHATMLYAVQKIFEVEVRTSNYTNVEELAQNVQNIKEEISQALGVQFEARI